MARGTCIACPICKAIVQMETLHEFRNRASETDPVEQWVFGRCVQCGEAALVHFMDVGADEWQRRQIYPSEVKPIDFALPAKVRESYEEALKCRSAGASLATAVMVRRTLEAVGKEFDPNARSLFAGLKAMLDGGLISDELFHWGEELRFLGNIGAHPTDDVVEAQDAAEALDFLNAIIETLYHLRPRFQAMRDRRHARKPPPT